MDQRPTGSPKDVLDVSERWASVDDVATHLGVRKDTVYRWIESRGLPARKVGKLWKAKLSEVDAWIQGGQDKLPAASISPADGSAHGVPSQPVVLVVDDDETIRQILCDVVSDQGYRAIAAADGVEALSLLRSPDAPTPSLVLLDLRMPNMDGLEFLEEQKRDADLATIPVVIITAAGDPPVGGTPVIQKPLDVARLIQAIRGVLG